ncbi:MAG: hypothetical protein Q4B84_00200 [Clostridia bacterium]|nr:hypothetical protein [Clostridia bacterium]
MSNLKKIRKKLLTFVLGTTLLTGGLVGIQSVSAMSSNKKGLGKIFLLSVMQKIRDKETLIKYAQINKKCLDTLKMTHINPIPVTKENVTKLFPQLQTLCLYGSETNVDEIKDKKIIFDYSFGIDEIIRNALFINGYDKEYSDELISKVKDVQEIFELELKLEKLNKHSSNSNSDQEKIQKIAERIQRIKEKYQNYQELEKNLSIELEGLLSIKNNKDKYNRLKKFMNCMASEFDDLELSEECEGIKYTIDTIESNNGKSKKALVYIVVKKGNKLGRRHLRYIIQELKKKGVEIPEIRNDHIDISNNMLDCGNIIFTIRPEREQKFEISSDSFSRFCNLTLNIVRARAGMYAFRSCSDSVINIYDSCFTNKDEDLFGGVIDNFILNVHNTDLGYM